MGRKQLNTDTDQERPLDDRNPVAAQGTVPLSYCVLMGEFESHRRTVSLPSVPWILLKSSYQMYLQQEARVWELMSVNPALRC